MYPPKQDFQQDEPVMGFPEVPSPMNQPPLQAWSTGICDCTQDCGNCCITFWVPCITFGQIAEIIDRGSPSCGASGALYSLLLVISGCQWVYSYTYRTKMQAEFKLEKSGCGDCFLHCCCEQLALCQMHRELKNRGLDPTLGWNVNMERRGPDATQAPFIPKGMVR